MAGDNPHMPLARLAATKEVVHIADVTDEPTYLKGDPRVIAAADLAGIRTMLLVPMLKENELVGAIVIYRQEVRPFTDKQIELVTSFAHRPSSRSRTLGCSTSCANRCSSRPPPPTCSRSSAARPSICRRCSIPSSSSAARLCDADMAAIARQQGDAYHLVSVYGYPPDVIEYVKTIPHEPGRGSVVGRTVLAEKTVHVTDVLADAEYTNLDMQQKLGLRTVLGVPLLREGKPIGVISLVRRSVRPFTEKQIELVTTFADQAVIAIENVRLFDEVQARTRELTQSVEELRALGDVTQAVNSTLDLQTVLDTIVAKATQLSGTEAGVIYVFDEANGQFQVHATYGMTPDMIAVIKEHHADFSEAVHAATQRREPDQVADLQPSSRANELVMRLGYRARLVVPLLAGDQIVGALVVRRKAPGEFPQNTVDLLADFRGAIGPGDPERAAIQRDRGEEPSTRGSKRAQVAVPRQHEPRTAHPAQRHHRAH